MVNPLLRLLLLSATAGRREALRADRNYTCNRLRLDRQPVARQCFRQNGPINRPATTMGDFMATIDWVVLWIYFLLMIGIGVWARRQIKTAADFFTAGGRMPWWLSG
ncbi:MAG TPA: hypothetical protein VK597_07620, partial [Inquilinus sp.]|nr:hypothetical protein [Inquilinus sp.]